MKVSNLTILTAIDVMDLWNCKMYLFVYVRIASYNLMFKFKMILSIWFKNVY